MIKYMSAICLFIKIKLHLSHFLALIRKTQACMFKL